MPHNRSMVVSPDGVWIYSIFGQVQNAPPSKLLAMKVGQVDGVSSLSVGNAGTGTGTIISSSGGINCGTSCWADFATGTSVSLAAVPGVDTVFSGWSGDPDCLDGIVTMTKNKNCIANFDRAYLVSVNKAGTGKGLVSSDSSQINCGNKCSAYFAPNSWVTLTAIPDVGFVFLGWTGSQCSGTGVCSLIVSSATTVTATFAPETAITASPPVISKSTTATFSFTSGGAASGFYCSLDGAAFTACTSPKTYTSIQTH